MRYYLRNTLAAVLLSYQPIFGVSGLQAADWSSNISQDMPKLEKHLKDAKGMGDLEKKIGPRLDKLRFFVILTNSDKDYIDFLISAIQSKTDYKARLEPMNPREPDEFYLFILEPRQWLSRLRKYN